jgi:hypothetical protein
MLRALREQRSRRWILLAVGLVILVALWRLAPAVLSVNRFPVDDFVEYWAAGRLNLTGGDPYSLEELAPLQRTVGLGDEATIRMWNPPWTFALVMPFALFSYPVGRLLWLLLNLSLLVAAVTYIWWYYDGPPKRRWVALLVLVTYMPALFVLRMGQIAPLMLAGLLGFLHFEERRRWFLAGAFAALVAIKPHLIYLFWIALLLWIIDRRVWKVPLGTLAALGSGIVVAWLANHEAVNQYLAAAAEYLPWDWATPTIGGGLRYAFGYQHVWLLWLAPLAGGLWFLWYWRRQRLAWTWGQQLPLLLVVSLATTPYGWEYDQVVALVPILQAAIWIVTVPWSRASTLLVIGYLALNGLALTINVARINAFWYLWLAPAFLLWYLLARRWLGCDRQSSPGGSPVLSPVGHQTGGRE